MAEVKAAKNTSRSEDTRKRLLRAALEEFGVHGYEAVSTRQLADRAGVNLAAIPYHFGNKQGVYLAVAEEIVANVRDALRGRTETIQGDLEQKQRTSQKRLLEHLHSLIEGLVRVLLSSPDAHLWAGIILREQMYPTEAFNILYNNIISQVHKTLTLIITRLLERPEDDPECILRAHSVIGEVVIFRAAREAIMRRMGWDDYTPRQVKRIIRILLQQTDDLLLAQRRRNKAAK